MFKVVLESETFLSLFPSKNLSFTYMNFECYGKSWSSAAKMAVLCLKAL